MSASQLCTTFPPLGRTWYVCSAIDRQDPRALTHALCMQQDHFGVSVGFNISMRDSLLSLETRPWVFLVELIRYLIWGTGLLLVPVLQLAVFTHSKLLDEKGLPTRTEKAFDEKLPDIEIMPVRSSLLSSPPPPPKLTS